MDCEEGKPEKHENQQNEDKDLFTGHTSETRMRWLIQKILRLEGRNTCLDAMPQEWKAVPQNL